MPRVCQVDLGNIRVLKEDEPKCIELHERLSFNNANYHSLLNQFVVPLRFSLMALTSARKCTVFDESGIIELMKRLVDLEFEGEKIYKV